MIQPSGKWMNGTACNCTGSSMGLPGCLHFCKSVMTESLFLSILTDQLWTVSRVKFSPKSLWRRNPLKKQISDLENDLKKCPHVSVNQDVGLDWCLLHHCIINIDSSQSGIKNWAIFQLYCLFLVLLHPLGGLARGLEKIKLVELCSL